MVTKLHLREFSLLAQNFNDSYRAAHTKQAIKSVYEVGLLLNITFLL